MREHVAPYKQESPPFMGGRKSIKGLRYREGLSQIEFAKKLAISQTNLSAMENGKRIMGKELAKRVADLFGLDYRIFL